MNFTSLHLRKPDTTVSRPAMAHLLPAELSIAILYGILQLVIGVAALWQQWYYGRMNGKTARSFLALAVTHIVATVVGIYAIGNPAHERNRENA